MSKLHVTSEYRWNFKMLIIVFRNSLIRVHVYCSDNVPLALLLKRDVYNWFECMSVMNVYGY